MPVSGILRAIFAALVLSGCAVYDEQVKQCDKVDQTTFSYGGVSLPAPEGCWFIGDDNSPVRKIECSNGRQGLAIADVSGVLLGTDK